MAQNKQSNETDDFTVNNYNSTQANSRVKNHHRGHDPKEFIYGLQTYFTSEKEKIAFLEDKIFGLLEENKVNLIV